MIKVPSLDAPQSQQWRVTREQVVYYGFDAAEQKTVVVTTAGRLFTSATVEELDKLFK